MLSTVGSGMPNPTKLVPSPPKLLLSSGGAIFTPPAQPILHRQNCFQPRNHSAYSAKGFRLENKLWANHDITDALVEVPRSTVVGYQWLWNASATQNTVARASFTEVIQFHGSHFCPSGMIHVDAALCRHSRLQINTFILQTHNTKPPFQNMLPASL